LRFPKGLKFITNLVYSKDDGLKCLGELEGVTQEVDVLNKQVTPDPNASGIGFYFETAAKVYPGSVDYQTSTKTGSPRGPRSLSAMASTTALLATTTSSKTESSRFSSLSLIQKATLKTQLSSERNNSPTPTVLSKL